MEARSRVRAEDVRYPELSRTRNPSTGHNASVSLLSHRCRALANILSYHDALRFNIKLGNRKMAVLWGEKQLQNELICLGDDHPDYKETLAMVDQLRNFARLSLLPIDYFVMDWV